MALVYDAVFVLTTRVLKLLAHRALEETLAALATETIYFVTLCRCESKDTSDACHLDYLVVIVLLLTLLNLRPWALVEADSSTGFSCCC